MIKITAYLTVLGFVLNISFGAAQEGDFNIFRSWNHEMEMNFYFLKDDFVLLPMVQSDRGKLHLEVRYNYEDLKTGSAWIGYNITGGNDFTFLITPMAGGVVGNTNGMASGLELTFDFVGFEFYSEMEYVFDLKSRENNFYYNWTDFTYSPKNWLWFGLSAQWTQLYQSELEIQRGMLVGRSVRQFDLTGYLYNLGSDDFYVILTFGVNF